MFEYYYFTRALEIVKQLPREVTIGIAAYAIVTDIHKRNSLVKVERIKAEAATRQVELEVEKLRLEIEKLEKTFPPKPCQ